MKSGVLLELDENNLIGKLVENQEDSFEIEIFYSSENKKIKKIGKSLQDALKEGFVLRGFLSPQTKIYVNVEEKIFSGRVVDAIENTDNTIDYWIRRPGHEDIRVNERFIFVRPWNAKAEDPSNGILSGSAESQFFLIREKKLKNI